MAGVLGAVVVDSFSITSIKLSLVLIYNLMLDPVVAISTLDLTCALIKLWWGTLLNAIGSDVTCGRIIAYQGQFELWKVTVRKHVARMPA